MTIAPKKNPKKEKTKQQSPEQRLEALRYNQMMYGATASELVPASKKVNFGGTYIKHDKFQELISAFKNGVKADFSVKEKDKKYRISTDENQILFDDKVIFYSRVLNKFENNLLLDKTEILRYQTTEAFVHLIFAVIRSLPDLGAPRLSYLNNEFLWDSVGLGVGLAEHGPNLLIGSYKIQKSKNK